MRMLASSAIAVLCLSACGDAAVSNNSNTEQILAAPAEPPRMNQVPFRLEYEVSTPNGPLTLVQAFEDGQWRYAEPIGEIVAVRIWRGQGQESYILIPPPRGPKALVLPAGTETIQNFSDELFPPGSYVGAPRYIGPCSAAGVSGQRWEADYKVFDSDETTLEERCVTSDGIDLGLRSSIRNRRLIRGDQPDNLFTIPPEYKVITFSEFETLLSSQ